MTRRTPPAASTGALPQPRYVAVAEALRQQITSGKVAIGAQLPPERELARHFGVAGMTIRQAIGLLEKKGLLVRRHGHGTFVQSATDGALIALVFGVPLHDESADFYRASTKALEQELHQRGWLGRVYSPPAAAPAENRFSQFQINLRNYSFNGLIRFATGSASDPFFNTLPGVPPSIAYDAPPLGEVFLDDYDFGVTIVSLLAAQGRRRIAYFRPGWVEGIPIRGRDVAGVLDTAQRLGLPEPEVRSILHQGMISTGGAAIYEAAREEIARWGGNPPDALLVKDDIAMHAVALALVQSGLNIPEDLVVACSGNDITPQPYGMDLIRYVYPMQTLAATLIDRLALRISGVANDGVPEVIKGHLVHSSAEKAPSLAPA